MREARSSSAIPWLAYLPMAVVLVPAMGRMYGKAGYYLHVAVIFGLVATFLLLYMRQIVVRRELVFVFLVPIFVMLFSSLYGVLMVHGRLVPADLIETMRPAYFLITILAGVQLGHVLSRGRPDHQELIWRYLFVALIGITLYNFAFSVLPFLRVEPFFSLSDFFGEDETFHKAYAAFRAYGITGQPGTQAILTNLVIVALLFLLDSGRRRFLCSAAIVLNVCSLVVTFSRIGLLMLALIVAMHLLLTGSRSLMKLLWIGAVPVVALTIAYWEVLAPYGALMLRGLNFESGDLGTLEYRLRFKADIVTAISHRLDTALFGFGPAKSYLPTLPGNLRNPDSSYSVYMVRYGLIGAVLYLLPYLYLFVFALLSRPRSAFLKRYRAMLLVMLVFIFTVANLDPPFEQWKIVLVMNVLLGIYVVVEEKEAIPPPDGSLATQSA